MSIINIQSLSFFFDFNFDWFIFQIDVEETDKNGNTALHWAAEKNRSESIEVLLQHRAKANRCNIQDMSPLHTACEMDMADSVRVSSSL